MTQGSQKNGSGQGVVRRWNALAHAWCVAAGLTLLSLAARPAAAQTLTVTVTGPAQSYSLASNPTPTQPMTIVTRWSWLWQTVHVCAYMMAPLGGSAGNPDTIPTNTVQVNGNPIAGPGGCGVGNARPISTWTNGFLAGFGGTHTDATNVRLSGFSATLEADTYRGTIYVVASTL